MIELYKYNDSQIKELMNSICIIYDTREHDGKNEHILDYFTKKNVKFKKQKLEYGDYSFILPKNEELGITRDLDFSKKVIIERKSNLEELSGNLTKERDRIEKELSLAPKNKVILIENANYSDVVTGNYNTQYSNKSYWATLHSLWHKYNVPIMFMPDIKYSGVFIKGYFEYYLRNILK